MEAAPKAGDDAGRLRHWCRRLEQFGVAVGDTMIRVVEYTAATPDPAAAKVLLQQQYDSLKNGS